MRVHGSSLRLQPTLAQRPLTPTAGMAYRSLTSMNAASCDARRQSGRWVAGAPPLPPPPRRRLPGDRSIARGMRRRAAQGGRADQPGWQQQPEAQQPPPTWERQAQAQAEYRQAQQAYQQAEAEVERAQKSYQGAQQDVEQTQRLQRAQEEYRQAKAARELSRANYEAILSRYQDFERELHEAQQEYLAAQQALAGQLGRAAAVAGGGGGGWLARSDGFVMGVVRHVLAGRHVYAACCAVASTADQQAVSLRMGSLGGVHCCSNLPHLAPRLPSAAGRCSPRFWRWRGSCGRCPSCWPSWRRCCGARRSSPLSSTAPGPAL